MSEIKKDIKVELDELFEICLNGEWQSFQESLEEVRWDISEMSDKERKSLKKLLKRKLNGL